MDRFLWLVVVALICLQLIELHQVSAKKSKSDSKTVQNDKQVKVGTSNGNIGNGQSCDSYFTTSTGTLTSPNHPSNYYDLAACSYIIDLQNAGVSSIAFHFNDFQLEMNYDNLYFGQGVHVDLSRQLGSFTGGGIPSYQVVIGDQMWFYFNSDSSVSARGFSITWFGLDIEESTTAEDPLLITTEQTTTAASTTIESTTLAQTTTVESATFAETTTEKYLSPEPTPPATGVDCSGDSLTAYIPRSLIGTVDGSHLHFLDKSCLGTNHNNTHVELSAAFDACGTIMEVQDDYVVFSNVVQDEALPEPGQVITRDRTIEIPVECRMEKEGLSSISFHPDTSKIVYSEEGYGKFSFNLQLYEDSSYVNPYPPEAYPIDIQLEDVLYFEAQVSAEQGLELFVKDCVATPSSEPTSTPQYEILEEGCPNDDTFQTFSSGDPMIQHFGLDAFAFVGSKTAIYVHCYLMLCNVTDPNSRCAQGCIAKSDVQKRSVAHTGSKPYVMSQGPISFNQDATNELNSGGESNATFNSNYLAVLMCSVGFMVLCVVASATILKKSRKPDDYVLIDGSED